METYFVKKPVDLHYNIVYISSCIANILFSKLSAIISMYAKYKDEKAIKTLSSKNNEKIKRTKIHNHLL